ncbi:MAG: AMP-dependent synthetase/ligase [Actinomycetota bacterium]
MFEETARSLPDDPALKMKLPSGEWETFTWSEYRERVRAIALGLKALGISRGDFVAILSRNRPEHVMADMGAVHSGATPISLYNTLAPEQIAYICNHSEAKIMFVEDVDFLERVLKVRAELRHQERIVIMNPTQAEGDVVTLEELIESGRAEHSANPSAFDELWRQVQPDDLLTLIYTSGTTGPPKGVMNKHRNILWDLESLRRMMELEPHDRVISYLPLAHAADRFLSHWQSLARGFTIYFCPDLAQLVPTMLEVRPTFFGAVPRVWEKLHSGLNAAISREPDDSKRTTIQSAISAGRTDSAARQRGLHSTDVAKHEPIFSALREKIGLDQMRVAFTGAAPTPYDVLEFFDAIGVHINEVWGMSELSAIATINPPDAIKLGTIGKPVPGAEARIAEDGELLIRGGLTMAGYYKEPEKTAETLAGGWMHTGDVATIDDEGYLRIVDRKKELIITAGGKNISPANLEAKLKEHPLIGQACVIGDNRAYLSALIVLDGEVAPAWARSHGIEGSSIAELSAHPEIVSEIERAVGVVNESVSRVENVRRWTILPAEWTAESEELTPTLKLKRRVINDKYSKEIETLYS